MRGIVSSCGITQLLTQASKLIATNVTFNQ